MVQFESSEGKRLFISFLFLLLAGPAIGVSAADKPYTLKAGDVLRVSVWGEELLDRETLVLPDGSITFPLVGRVGVSNLTLDEVVAKLAPVLSDYVPSPEVSVEILQTNGSRIYVLGKVTSPGPQILDTPLSVIQALARSGGITTFADQDGIKLLRDTTASEQSVFDVDYQDISRGNLETNYKLQAGDVLLVP